MPPQGQKRVFWWPSWGLNPCYQTLIRTRPRNIHAGSYSISTTWFQMILGSHLSTFLAVWVEDWWEMCAGKCISNHLREMKDKQHKAVKEEKCVDAFWRFLSLRTSLRYSDNKQTAVIILNITSHYWEKERQPSHPPSMQHWHLNPEHVRDATATNSLQFEFLLDTMSLFRVDSLNCLLHIIYI